MKHALRLFVAICLVVLFMTAVQAVDQRSDYHLSVAAHKGHVAEVEQLLAKGVSPDFSCHGLTPRIACSVGGHEKVAALLVTRGANVNLRSKTRPASLITAATNNDLGLVKFLLDHNAEINLKASFVLSSLTLTGDECRDLDQPGDAHEFCAHEIGCMTALSVATDKKMRDLLLEHGATE